MQIETVEDVTYIFHLGLLDQSIGYYLAKSNYTKLAFCTIGGVGAGLGALLPIHQNPKLWQFLLIIQVKVINKFR